MMRFLLSLLTALLIVNGVSSPVEAARVDGAQAALEAGQYEYAFIRWKSFLSRNRQNVVAREGLESLHRIAARLYEEALMIRSAEPGRAKDKLRSALSIARPGSTMARHALEALGDEI